MPSTTPGQPTAPAQPMDATRIDFRPLVQFAMDIRGLKRLLQSLRRASAAESLAPSASSQLSPAAAAAVRAGGVAQGPCKSTSWQAQVPRPCCVHALCLLVVHTQMSQRDAYYENAAVRRATRIAATALSTNGNVCSVFLPLS